MGQPKLFDTQLPTSYADGTIQTDAISNLDGGVEPTAQFVASIREFGIRTRLWVIENSDGTFEVIDGLRRSKAAKIIGLEAVPVEFFHAEDREALIAALTMIANYHRSYNPVSEYDALAKLIAEGHTEKEVSQFLKIPIQKIKQLRKIGSLIPELLDAFNNGQIAVSVARSIAGMPKKRQKLLLTPLRENERVTGTDVRKAKSVVEQEAAEKTIALWENRLFTDSGLAGDTEEANTLSEIKALAESALEGSKGIEDALIGILELIDG